MKKDSRRSQRVADLVRAEISSLVLIEAHDPDLRGVTITDVEMPSDLRSARVFFSCLGGEDERAKAGEALKRAARTSCAARSDSAAGCATRRSSTSSPTSRSSAGRASRSSSTRSCRRPADDDGEGA